MENQTSRPSIILPEIPPDFEAKAGTSRTDFANALFELIESAKIGGLIASTPPPFDLAKITSDVAILQAQMAAVAALTPKRRASPSVLDITGSAADFNHPITFDDIGTSEYEVRVTFYGAGTGTSGAMSFRVVEGTRTPTGCTLRIFNVAGDTKFSWVVEALVVSA